MAGFAQKPGGATLVQQSQTGAADVVHPGKQTLTELVSHAVVQRSPAQAGTGGNAAAATSTHVRKGAEPPGAPVSPLPSTNATGGDTEQDWANEGRAIAAPGKSAPLRGHSWTSIAEVAESVLVQDDRGDTLRIDATYRLETRPAEVGEIPDLWVHTERKALLTIGTGEHAGATIVGQARVHLARAEARDPKAAIDKASIGASHWAQIYLAEAQQFVNIHGPGGRASLRADASRNDVLAYDDPLRTLAGLKSILKEQHVAGHGREVAALHGQAQRLLVDVKRGRAVLEREIAAVSSHHDAHPGRVAPVKFLVGDISEWLAVNQRAGRDETEDARLLRKARDELEQLISDAELAHPAKRDQLDDALSAPVRFAERSAEGVLEIGAMAVDAVVLGVDAIGKATGIGTFGYHPLSRYGRSIDATGASTTTALVTIVNGFADEWSDAIERAKHGDYRGMADVSFDTLMMIDGMRGSGLIALEKVDGMALKVRRVAKSAHALARGLHGEIRDIAAAMADGADAFASRLQPAAGMQMAGAGASGGPGPNIGGALDAAAVAEAAKVAKEAFRERRRAQRANKSAEHTASHTDTPNPSTEKATAEQRAERNDLAAKGLDGATAQRFAALGKEAGATFATLSKQSLERFAQLDDAALRRFGELPAADLQKFRLLDETALRRFAFLDETRLKQFAGQFDANGLKALGALDLANFTEPRTTAAALDHAGGHSYAKHGAATTPAQHELRLKTGTAPDGSSGTAPLESGRFVSDDAQVAAAKLADAQLVNEALNAKGTQLKKIVDDIIINLPGAGVSYSLDASGQLVARPASRVLAIYKLQPGADGMRYVLYTMYPIP